MTTDLLNFCIKWLSRFGHIAIIVSAGLGFLLTFIFALRSNQFRAFLFGIGWLLLVFVVQLTAHKFLTAGEIQIRNNPTQLSSKSFLDCVAFLAMVGGIVVLIWSIVEAAQRGVLEPFVMGVAIFFGLEFLALVTFNPSSINIHMVEDNSAGQEAIGIITYFIKAVMKLIPILFGVGVIVGTVQLFLAFFRLFGERYGAAMMYGSEAAMVIMISGLLPLMGYIFFALAYLAIDVIQAILSIPGKLDRR